MEKFRDKYSSQEDGFTLIEILVVILIIGILAAIAIPVFLNQRKKTNDSTVQSDIRNAVTTAESQVNKLGKYPTMLSPAPVTSRDVGISYFSNGFSYCIKGTHANANSSWYYDSVMDGITTNSCNLSLDASGAFYQAAPGASVIYPGAGTWQANGTGPSGDVAMTLQHNTGTDRGWGIYGKYDISGLNIPAGSKVKISYYAKSSSPDGYGTQVSNDNGTQVAAYYTHSLPNNTTWVKVNREITTASQWTSGTHFIRFNLGNNLSRLDVSDVQVEIISAP